MNLAVGVWLLAYVKIWCAFLYVYKQFLHSNIVNIAQNRYGQEAQAPPLSAEHFQITLLVDQVFKQTNKQINEKSFNKYLKNNLSMLLKLF